MKAIYHLSTCNTCQRILKTLNLGSDFTLRDIKDESITPEELEAMKALAGSYEALFSKRARLYRQRGLHEKTLGEAEYKALILEHYTFLKRPVIVAGDQIFIGNTAKTVAAATAALAS
ncbi:Arsenate reductase, glutaredoxin family [Robiginitalea myxolifaciens]|uniref:Arsenate reductase, glutaredoxin family n=1 Tax=Robiginitalea myxolifaciens TaxID=400055 RepID=A0A1I6G634_9FLAO|nr:ArsC/Spx/MgsR family protein [Robiginitalea myxolifaciens]SFR37663.1 Arsenate reductase, glutaredoxin family [Robiginitalea myxolifaciens]